MAISADVACNDPFDAHHLLHLVAHGVTVLEQEGEMVADASGGFLRGQHQRAKGLAFDFVLGDIFDFFELRGHYSSLLFDRRGEPAGA